MKLSAKITAQRKAHGLSQEELADRHGVELRTVYRDLRDATARLTALIFGVEGVLHSR